MRKLENSSFDIHKTYCEVIGFLKIEVVRGSTTHLLGDWASYAKYVRWTRRYLANEPCIEMMSYMELMAYLSLLFSRHGMPPITITSFSTASQHSRAVDAISHRCQHSDDDKQGTSHENLPPNLSIGTNYKQDLQVADDYWTSCSYISEARPWRTTYPKEDTSIHQHTPTHIHHRRSSIRCQ